MKKILFLINFRFSILREKNPIFWVLLSFFLWVELANAKTTVFNKSFYIQEEFKSSENNNRNVADSLFDKTDSYIKEGNFLDALKTAEKALGYYNTLKDKKLIGNCYSKIATIFYYQSNYAQALLNFENSILQYKSVDFKEGMASSANNKGAIYYYLGNYPEALKHYKQALKLDEALNNTSETAATLQNIGGIYLELDEYENALQYFKRAQKTYRKSSDKNKLSQVFNAIGETYIKQHCYDEANAQFVMALQFANEAKDEQRVLESVFNLGELSRLQYEYKKSLTYYNRSLQFAKNLNNDIFKARSSIGIGLVFNKLNKKQEALANCEIGLKIATKINTVAYQEEACNCLYKINKSLNRNGTALAYYERAVLLTDSLQTHRTANDIQQMEFKNQMLRDSIVQVEKEQKQIQEHEKELVEKENQRNLLIATGCIILVVAGGLYGRLNYTKKAKAALQVEKDLSEHLLLNILPEEIAIELKEKGYVDAQDFDSASILFTDFKSFTETASKLTPQELVEEINVCFKAFDAIMERHDIEKIKTIGDAYMAAGGLPKPSTDSVKKTILAALDMQKFISERKQANNLLAKPAFEMRVGVHVGPIVAGIVGVKKFQYDIWGDTVNTASRMESNGSVGKVNISENLYNMVKAENDLAFEYRGKIAAKGKGELGMYFVSHK
ncbi:adenylate/guanylate cyclase domain-containing protein [Zobellia sp. B3R18]|uniref:adenylate/guanylate cyclase domain-containing protein n=1 Tax=Zobellia sp. B3R18 TaxID=2841568 RepID=UPI001C06D774|nr:adenylate/guanylate cyclase domain-containing protein [Zobellia sp. B3R18]MBU2974973.1 tetratricopeptide repeat protein [Zobellia sp. B3R18]